ncbi:hypothetical protein [Kamptonema formosum]|uniref:hypothetical protein n=1 Tax=Kamptonema formosum TaxID=331992 RepID=UPI00034D9896|nr:hypothetical protein [Oscillatoria sp. PCC 10802]
MDYLTFESISDVCLNPGGKLGARGRSGVRALSSGGLPLGVAAVGFGHSPFQRRRGYLF